MAAVPRAQPEPEKVALSREKETLLITLYAKGEESRLPDSLLHDHFAAEAMSRIDYDFSKLHVGRDDMIGLAMRAYILDGWTREFIAKYPRATVLHLGCGLDSRVFRVDPPPSVRWIDVDYPEVIALRRRLYPEREGYAMIGASVTEPGWLASVPSYRPAMIVAEGLFMYLAEDAVPQLLARLTRHFPGGHVAFDSFSRLGLQLVRYHRSVRATGAILRWSIDDPHELERRIPKMKLLTELTAYDPNGYDPRQVARMSWRARMAVRVFAWIPPLGRLGRLLRYSF
ncbi:class I SAM-dependent methyltransferase [Variovorax sp. MHTC-1]|uniref:class I SAM-dependent methyltransferase n=1 Tax=Variovorax sp. MHTC-1 TaxID=2495593 RepID=UPI000F89B8E2|nr:class I SAM-dependent methyltransferase [Variovorax sp. MHTC-1]RST55437.1 class I SAM-dependent methyltransferase [Variovorax sp. MHTC-1]